MKKSFIIDGIILIFLSLILCFITLTSSDYFAFDIIFSVIIGLAGVFLVISGVTGKVLFKGKELKTAPIKPKREYNVKKTFIVTGIVQAAFLLIYALWVVLFYCLPDKGVIADIMMLLFGLLILAPVMPACLVFNAIALANSSDRNNKTIKWFYVIFCALAMTAAWLIYGGFVVSLTGI